MTPRQDDHLGAALAVLCIVAVFATIFVSFLLAANDAQASEAGTATTPQSGVVHEHAVPKGCAQ